MKKHILFVCLLLIPSLYLHAKPQVCWKLELDGTKQQLTVAQEQNDKEEIKRLTKQYNLNKSAIAAQQAGKFQLLKDWYGQDNSHQKAVEYAFAVEYAQLTKGGTFCRVPEEYVKRFFNKYKNTPCREIVQQLFLKRYQPIKKQWEDTSDAIGIQRYIMYNYLSSLLGTEEAPMPEFFIANNHHYIDNFPKYFAIIKKSYQAINQPQKEKWLKSLWLTEILTSPFYLGHVEFMEENDGILWKCLAGTPTPEQIEGTKRFVKWCEQRNNYTLQCPSFIKHAKQYGYYEHPFKVFLKKLL